MREIRLRPSSAASDKLPQKEVRPHEPAEAEEEAEVEVSLCLAVGLRWKGFALLWSAQRVELHRQTQVS